MCIKMCMCVCVCCKENGEFCKYMYMQDVTFADDAMYRNVDWTPLGDWTLTKVLIVMGDQGH